MAGVSIAALLSSSVQPGDTVLVVGGGLVGNFATQLFHLAGADVIIADLSKLRLPKTRVNCRFDQKRSFEPEDEG